MRYTVDALRQLADVWTNALDRTAVTTASHRLDTELTRDPQQLGESRNSSVNRTTVALPLGIEFEIIEDDKTVRVVRVWQSGDELPQMPAPIAVIYENQIPYED